jgi:hypothetical protein
MQINMNWPEVSALLAGATLLCGALGFGIRAIVREEVGKLRADFMPRDLADERYDAHSRRLEIVEKHIEKLHVSKVS